MTPHPLGHDFSTEVGEFDSPSSHCRLEFFQIEGRAVGVCRPGAGGLAWVWDDDRWRWAPALATKDGVPLAGSTLAVEFPEIDMAAIVHLASHSS